MPASAEGSGSAHPNLVLAIIMLSYLMIALDICIVITALPLIREEFGYSAAGLSWVHNAYTLAFGGLLLPGARAGDVFGRRRIFLVGLAIFTLASLGVGIAPTSWALLASRALQGVGAAILVPATLALIPEYFPAGRERTRAIAYHGMIAGIGGSLGLVVGGVLADTISWRAGFFLNLPLGIGLGIAALRLLRPTEPRPGGIDPAGAAMSALGMTALVHGVVNSARQGWDAPATIAPIAAGIALLAMFVRRQRTHPRPVMPLRLFADSERSAAYAARFLYLGAMMGFWFFITQFMQLVLGFSPFEAGLGFLPMTLVNFAVALAVPALTHRIGNGALLAGGLFATMLGMLWLSRLASDSAYLTGLAAPMVLIGLGQGASLAPLTAAGIANVAGEDAGAASGLVSVAHQLGGSLGLAILVALFAMAGDRLAGPAELFTQRTDAALIGGAAMLLLALVIVATWIIPREGRRRPASA